MARIKSFQYWLQQEVEQKFGIKKVPTLLALSDLLNVKPDSDDLERKQLEKLTHFEKVNELKMHRRIPFRWKS